MRLIKPLGLLLANALLAPQGARPFGVLMIQIVLIIIMFTCIGWRIKTPKTSFVILHQLVQANIPAELKRPRDTAQTKPTRIDLCNELFRTSQLKIIMQQIRSMANVLGLRRASSD